MACQRRQLISKQLFTEHFWWVYNRLQSRADGDYTTAAYFRFMTLLGAFGTLSGAIMGSDAAVEHMIQGLARQCALCPVRVEQTVPLHTAVPTSTKMPYATCCCSAAAFRVFLAEKVDVAILEVGLGGRLDATNCVPQPVVCGVSALGYDHMELLGNTLRV